MSLLEDGPEQSSASDRLDGGHGRDICYRQHVDEEHGKCGSGENTIASPGYAPEEALS